MNVKRFFAPSAREALRALKAELGADAIVLSNRAVAGGVEITALPPGVIAASPRREVVQPRQPEIRPFVPPRIDTATASRQNPGAITERVAEKVAEKIAEKVAMRGEGGESVRVLQEASIRLMDELSGIRGVIERELAGFSWHDTRASAPVRAEMLGQLLTAGFSPFLARQLVEGIGRDTAPGAALDVLRAALDRRLKIRANANEIIDDGGIYALVGPTGVGKTTTVAKLAARFVTRQGAGRLALITTDGYRIGAQEQLRIYGRILGVPVFSVRDAAELRQTLVDLRDKRLVLIDTMGMNQRDRMVVTQANMLSDAGEVRRLLLLNATCRGDTLDDVVKAFAGQGVAGCILTKVDEAASLAPSLDTAIRRELDVRYITNGQRVPEDLHLPNRAYLLQRVLHPQPDESFWRLDGDETGAMLRTQGA